MECSTINARWEAAARRIASSIGHTQSFSCIATPLFIQFTHSHSFRPHHRTQRAHHQSITTHCGCTASILHVGHPPIIICTTHRRHSGTDSTSTFTSLTLHNHAASNGFTHLRSTPAAQKHDRKSHTTNLIVCSTNSSKTPGRHCSRRSITTTHVTALTNHLSHCYCITTASLGIISHHKKKHSAQRAIHAHSRTMHV